MKREFEKTWLEYNIAYGNNLIDTEKIRALNDFYIRQKSLGRDVTFFTMPSHVSEFYLIYKNGCRKDYELWKKELSQIAPVYDFQYPNKYTTDKIAPDMQTYFDASHSTYLVGNKIMEDIVLGKTDFARLLTKDNVEQYNRQNFIDLQTWAKNNKDMLDWINNTLKEEKNAI